LSVKAKGSAIDEGVFKTVVKEIAETRERGEIDCDECCEELDRFTTI